MYNKSNRLFFILVLMCVACGQSANVEANPANGIAETTGTSSPKISSSISLVLQGNLWIEGADNNKKYSLAIINDKDVIEATRSQGIEVKLPEVDKIVKFDMVNCAGFLGNAEVTFNGLEHPTWKADVMVDSIPQDLGKRLAKCDDENGGSVYLLTSTDGNLTDLSDTKKPDLKKFINSLPEKVRANEKLNTKASKSDLSLCLSDLVDSDGDGEVDLASVCAYDKTTSWEYYVTLRKIEGNWKEIWHTPHSKN